MPIETVILILGVFASAAAGAGAAIWWVWNREMYFFREYLHNRDKDISIKHEILLNSSKRAHERITDHVEKFHTIQPAPHQTP